MVPPVPNQDLSHANRANHDPLWLNSLPRLQPTPFGPAAFNGINDWLDAGLAQFLIQNQPLLPGLAGRITKRDHRLARRLAPQAWIPEGAQFFQGMFQGARWVAAIHGDFGAFARGLLRDKVPTTLFETVEQIREAAALPSVLQVGLVCRWVQETFLVPLAMAGRTRGYDCPPSIQSLRTARPPLLFGWAWELEWEYQGAKLLGYFLLPEEASQWPELGQDPARDWDRAQEILKQASIPVEIRLGGTWIGLKSLSRLKPGDCLVLDQPINEPLKALVGGKVPGWVWPGRVNRLAAIQWESLGADPDTPEKEGQTS